ncbi:outer membrane beta-barrel protein [Riemerella anatipestifer]|nr:outer membrane beta-barrel protein [Riemerella anatipestifer]
MKKLFLVGAVALFGAMNAQTEKGSWVVEGKTNLGFNNVSTKVKYDGKSYDDGKVSTFNISPSVGYFVMDNLALGLELNFLSAKSGDETNSTFSLLPNATYYFSTGSQFRPYLGAGVGYASTTSKYNNLSSTVDGLAWGVKGGGVYMLNKTAGINIGLGYNQFSTTNNDVTTTVGTFGVNAGFSLFFK